MAPAFRAEQLLVSLPTLALPLTSRVAAGTVVPTPIWIDGSEVTKKAHHWSTTLKGRPFVVTNYVPNGL
jgi:hypothetical protein